MTFGWVGEDPMSRSTIVFGLALVAVTVTVGGVALHYWNRGPTPRPDVSARLAVAATTPDSGTIDLSGIATFAWTDLYIVPPYSTKNGAEKRMGVSWPWRWNQIEYRDGISLLVFVDSTSGITGIVEHPRGQGDFVTRGGIQHFAKANAVFTAVRRADSWVLFHPVANASK